MMMMSLMAHPLIAQFIPPSGGGSSDCVGSILICGNAEIGITPNGVGQDEFSNLNNPEPSCLEFSKFAQAWFRVEIETTGTFTFEINPDDGVADYDFAVFGPTADCGNLGEAIRCSSTNPRLAGVPAATGLNDIETDLTEGPGQIGNGFLRRLDVEAGETYYIVVALAVGSGGFTISTGGTTTFPQAAIATDVDDIDVCDDDDGSRDGFQEFDFTNLNSEIINGQPNANVSYHTSLNDANLGVAPISFPYTNTSNPQEIFYRVERTDSQCADFNSFMINVDGSRIDVDVETIFICSNNATETFDFDTIIDQLVSNSNAFDISYYNSLSDAQNETNSQTSTYTVTPTITTAYIKIVDPTSAICDQILNVPLQLDNPPSISNSTTLEVCDDDFDEVVSIDLRDQNDVILNGLDPRNHEVFYYESMIDRDLDQNRLPSNFTNTSNPQFVYVRVINNISDCFIDRQYELVVNPRPFLEPQLPITICTDSPESRLLTVESGFAFYEWSTGESGATLNSIDVTAPGDFTVVVTNAFGCQDSITITVEPSEIAILQRIDITDFQNGNNSASVVVTGSGDYEFAVDDEVYQDSPDFSNLGSGFHNLFVRDKNGCGVLEEEFGILDFEPFFTPNGDGFNDIWTLEALREYPEARLLVFDRYGKLLKQLAYDSVGWDGTFNGEPLPSSTYWYTVEIPDRPIVRGFFAMKR